MRRVLLVWRYNNYYQFLTRIDDSYVIPQDTANATFYEAFIINDNEHSVINEWELFLPKTGARLVENGRDLGQFITKTI